MAINMITLKREDKGGYVKELQKYLTSLNYDIGESDIDGVFGEGTELAVKQFQRNHELVIDGIVGRRTWTKLYEDLGIT